MKRKLIKQGAGGFTITLPIDWIRKQGIGTQTDLDVEEMPEGLLIKQNAEKSEKTITIKIEKENASRIRTLISSAYRRGYNNIIIQSNNDLAFQTIQQITESLLGLIIVQQKKKEIIIKNIVEIDPRTLPSILQKFFTMIHVLQEEVLESLEKKTKEDASSLHASILKHRDYCQLLIHKTVFQNDKAYEYYLTVFLAEKIAGTFEDMRNMKKNWSRNEKEAIRKKIQLFEELQHAFFAKKLAEAIALNTKLSEIRKQELEKQKIYPSIHIITEYMFGLSSRIVAILL